MSKKSTLTILCKSKRDERKSDPIIRVSDEMYQILKDFAHETGLTLKDFTETLLKFALEHIKVEYSEG